MNGVKKANTRKPPVINNLQRTHFIDTFNTLPGFSSNAEQYNFLKGFAEIILLFYGKLVLFTKLDHRGLGS